MQWQDSAGRFLNSFAQCLSLCRNTELPFIPNELVEIIFTMAAASSRESCKQLCLVATWSRQMVLPYLRQTVVISKPTHYEELMAMSETYETSSLTSHTLHTEKLWVGTDVFTKDEHVATFPRVFRQFPNIKHLTLPGDCFSVLLEEAAKMDTFSEGPDLHVTVLEPYILRNSYPYEHRYVEPSRFSHRITHLYHTTFISTFAECSVDALTNVKELAIHITCPQIHAFRQMLPSKPLADTLEKYIVILGSDSTFWDAPSRLYIDEQLPLTVVIPQVREQQPNMFVWHRKTPEHWEDEVDWNWDAAIKYTAQLS